MDLRIAVLGVGVMGADHVERITKRINGARVAVVNDVVSERAGAIAATAGARVAADPLEAIAADDVDAVLLATPGNTHEAQLLACLEHGKPVLCEKPLTTDARSALDIARREHASGRRLIQVGFMRRFDHEFAALKSRLDAGELGTPLLIHCIHRNPAAPPHFDSTLIVKDSLVHEVDVARFLLGEDITAITVLKPAPSSKAPAGLQDPQLAILETERGRIVDAEVFVSTGVSYEVRTEVVGETGSAIIGLEVARDFRVRFAQAYDTELQRWVDAVHAGSNVDGPTAWDGYAAAAVCEAGVQSLRTGERVKVEVGTL